MVRAELRKTGVREWGCADCARPALGLHEMQSIDQTLMLVQTINAIETESSIVPTGGQDTLYSIIALHGTLKRTHRTANGANQIQCLRLHQTLECKKNQCLVYFDLLHPVIMSK